MASDQAVQPDTPAAGGPAPQATGGVLANRDFLKLWAGESISQLGTQVTQFAMPLVAVLTLKATVLEVGVLNALRFIPVIVFSLLAGVWLDRRRRRPVLIACALGSAVVIGLVPLASVFGVLSFGLLCVVTALVGTLSMTFDVGALSYVPSLVERRHLLDSNGKLQASSQFAGIAGPGLAGLLVGLITAPITLSVDAVSYLFSALGLIAISTPEPAPEPAAEPVPIRRSIAEGLRAVYGSKLLRSLLTQSATLNLCFSAVITVFVVYAIRVLGLTPAKLGIVLGASAVGGLIGALVAARLRAWLGFGHTMLVSTIGISAPLLLMIIPRGAGLATMVILVVSHFSYGFSIVAFNVNSITLRQIVTPKAVLARMNASYRMLLYGAGPVGAIAGGLLGNVTGLRPALVISVIAMTSPALWIIFSPVYQLRDMPDGPSPD